MQLRFVRTGRQGRRWLWAAWAVAQPAGAQAPPAAQAQSHEPPPALAAWIAETEAATGAYPRHLAFLAALPEKDAGEPPQFLTIDAAAFNQVGYFHMVDQTSAAWSLKINSVTFTDVDPLVMVVKLTHADTVVIAPETGDWQLLRPGSRGDRTVVLAAKPPKSKAPQDVCNWLMQNLGWDGVVIGQKGEYLLVGSTSQTLATPETQALAVGDSADKLVLAKAERHGTGLLSLSEAKGGYAVFDIVLLDQGVAKLTPGTKLLIEKK